MSHTAGSVARHGFGFGALAVATLGFLVAPSTPVVDVVGCAHATVAFADTAGAVMSDSDCAHATSALADAASVALGLADTSTITDATADVASAALGASDTASITMETC